jgi:hypothetical protein
MRLVLGVALVVFSSSPLRFSSALSGLLILAVFAASYADLRRRQEGSLLHNLGMPVMLIVAISTIPAVLAESAIGIAQRLIK